MAFKYRQITPQRLDLINPDDWNVNVREYTNEFNGHLDRDNLPEKGITTDSIKSEAFHIVKSDLSTTIEYVEKTQSYFKEIQIIEFETQHQGIVMCEWSSYWTYEYSEGDLGNTSPQRAFFRIVVNGTEISQIQKDSNLKKSSVGYMAGALPVEAGIVKGAVEVMTDNVTTFNTAQGFPYDVTSHATGLVAVFDRSLVVVLRKA